MQTKQYCRCETTPDTTKQRKEEKISMKLKKRPTQLNALNLRYICVSDVVYNWEKQRNKF